MDEELKKLQEMAGITDTEYDKAITALAKYTIYLAKDYYGDGKTRGPFDAFATDRDMMDTVMSRIKDDIVDTIKHLERFKGM